MQYDSLAGWLPVESFAYAEVQHTMGTDKKLPTYLEVRKGRYTATEQGMCLWLVTDAQADPNNPTWDRWIFTGDGARFVQYATLPDGTVDEDAAADHGPYNIDGIEHDNVIAAIRSLDQNAPPYTRDTIRFGRYTAVLDDRNPQHWVVRDGDSAKPSITYYALRQVGFEYVFVIWERGRWWSAPSWEGQAFRSVLAALDTLPQDWPFLQDDQPYNPLNTIPGDIAARDSL